MDRLTKLERKVDVIAKWFGPEYSDGEKVLAALRDIDAEPTTPPRPADLAYGDGRVSVWNEIEAILGDCGIDVTRSTPDRIQALIEEVRRLRSERDAESRRAMAAEGDSNLMRDERDDARSEIERLKSEARDDKEALDHYRSRVYRDGEADQLQRDLDAARAALAMKERERDAARRERDAARAEIEKLKENLTIADRFSGQWIRQAGDAHAAAQRAESELKAARAEIALLEARDREGRWIAVRSAWGQPNIVGADATEWRNRRSAYLSVEPPRPDPLLVEVRIGGG